MKRITVFLLALCLLFSLTACGGDSGSGGSSSGIKDVVIPSANDTASTESVTKNISLNGSSVSADKGVKVEGTTVLINAAGVYSVSGTLNDGRIVINTGEDKGKVTLILNGADITCLTDSAIRVERASKVKLVAQEGTVNTVTSGTQADLARVTAESTGAAISASDNLDLEGSGLLTVNGYLNNGIASKNNIDVEGANLVIVAANNGLRGSDSVEIKGGSVTITAGNDGIKANTADNAEKGYVTITEGDIAITAGGDGISAQTVLRIQGGNLAVFVSGSDEENTCRALRAGILTMDAGTVELSSDGEGIRCGGDVTINGGTLNITAAKNGFHTKSGVERLSFNGGTVMITSGKNPIDCEGNVSMNGGTLLAVGSAKNFKSFVPASSQAWFAASLTGSAETVVTVEGESLTAAYSFNTVAFSSSALSSGSEYTVTAGEASTTATAK